MIMAVALSRKHNAEIVGIFDDVWTNIPRHLGIRHEDGAFGDARGLKLSESEFLDGYPQNNTKIQTMTTEEVMKIWGKRVESWDVDSEILGFLDL